MNKKDGHNKWKNEMFNQGWRELRKKICHIKINTALNVGLGVKGGQDSIRWLKFLTDVFDNNIKFTTIELFQKYIDKKEKNKLIEDVVLCDVRNVDKKFEPKSFDMVFWSQGPEHIKRDEWKDTFRRIDIVAKKLIIFHTPWGSGYDDCKDHLSLSIRRGEMEEFGFTCFYGGKEDTKQASIRGYKILDDWSD